MKLGAKIPIELSDARAARIARGLFERLDREEGEEGVPLEPKKRRRGWALAAAALAVALTVLAVGRMHFGSTAPQTVAESNPSRVVTGVIGSHLAFGDVSLDVAPESELVVSGSEGEGMLVVLGRGSVTCEVAPRGKRAPFVVVAGAVRVRVVGTKFTVTRDGEGARVSVVHGTVEVNSGGTTARVSDGESWPPLPRSEAPIAAAPATEVSVHARENTGSAATAGVIGAGQDSSTRRAATQAAPVHGRPAASRTSRPEVLPAAPAAVATVASARAGAAASDPAATSALNPKSVSLGREAVQEKFERAEQLEAHDPGHALAIYQDIAAGNTPWAPDALFAEASLEQARGNVGAAMDLLQDYLRRYPQGVNAGAARSILERLR